MTIVLLTHQSHYTVKIQHILQSLHTKPILTFDLCMLEKVSRNTSFDLLLVDNDFLTNNENIDIVSECIGILNNKSPIVCFNKQTFEISIKANEKTLTSEINDIIITLLKNAQIQLELCTKFREEFLRPIELKLYSFLKNSKKDSTSLEEMALYLWGNTNNAHTNTLYSYIHRIKNMLKESEGDFERLTKEKKGCYKISIDVPLHINDFVATSK